MKTWASYRNDFHVDVSTSKSVTLTTAQTVYQKFAIAISGVAAGSITSYVHVWTGAGKAVIDLAAISSIVLASGNSACLINIAFPVRGFTVEVNTGGSTPIDVSIVGGND